MPEGTEENPKNLSKNISVPSEIQTEQECKSRALPLHQPGWCQSVQTLKRDISKYHHRHHGHHK
jgi:hypothetical protein